MSGDKIYRSRPNRTSRNRSGDIARIFRVTEDGEHDPRRTSRVSEALVRVANVAVAILALVLLSPLIALIALSVKIDSRGPILYRQLRVGLDRRHLRDLVDDTGRRASDLGGRPFLIYKFRTMSLNAELESGPVWAEKDDVRTTRVGDLLRKTRLDEIPQFWNVLRGEMSVVGPRPERPIFVRQLRREIAEYRFRNRVRPGITGWAQINQGYDRDVQDVRSKVGYDLEYVRNQSLWFDLVIMLKTLPVMFTRRGK
jgi:lipopolysaccharide/colanic/teichoic acid biosynthesis glycosyltransferase